MIYLQIVISLSVVCRNCNIVPGTGSGASGIGPTLESTDFAAKSIFCCVRKLSEFVDHSETYIYMKNKYIYSYIYRYIIYKPGIYINIHKPIYQYNPVYINLHFPQHALMKASLGTVVRHHQACKNMSFEGWFATRCYHFYFLNMGVSRRTQLREGRRRAVGAAGTDSDIDVI